MAVAAGVLAGLDGFMNIAMEQTEEYVAGQLKNKYGDCFIRGNNGAALSDPCDCACVCLSLAPLPLVALQCSTLAHMAGGCEGGSGVVLFSARAVWLVTNSLRGHHACVYLPCVCVCECVGWGGVTVAVASLILLCLCPSNSNLW